MAENLKDYILQYMRKYNIGLGNSKFAEELRKIADYIDD